MHIRIGRSCGAEASKSMDEKSLFSVRHWGIGRLLLIAAVCFAMAAVVFFVATWLQRLAPGGPNQNTAAQMSVEDKQRILDSLNQNTAAQMSVEDKLRVVNSLSATTSPNETSHAAKLEMLQSLNAN